MGHVSENEGQKHTKRRKILRRSLTNEIEDGEQVDSGEGFMKFMTKMNSVNSVTTKCKAAKDLSLKNTIQITLDRASGGLLKKAYVENDESVLDCISWYQYPLLVSSSNTIKNRIAGCKLQSSSSYLAHQSFMVNFGKDAVDVALSDLESSLFFTNIGKELPERNILFRERTAWGKIFLSACNQVQASGGNPIYVFESRGIFLIERQRILVSSSTIKFRKKLKSYGIKFKTPLDTHLSTEEHLNNITGLEKLRRYKAGIGGLSKLQRVESIRDGTERSALVIDDLLSNRLFVNYYLNSVCRRDGIHALPVIYSFEKFKGSSLKRARYSQEKSTITLSGVFLTSRSIELKRALRAPKLKIIMKSERSSNVFNLL